MGSGYAKQKKAMKEAMAAMQTQAKQTHVEGVSGNGLVTVAMNGEHSVTRVKIKPECIDPTDAEGLEDLVRAAINDAAQKLKEAMPNF